MLSTKSESRDECSNSVLDSIDCNQMRIFHFGLAFIIKKSND